MMTIKLPKISPIDSDIALSLVSNKSHLECVSQFPLPKKILSIDNSRISQKVNEIWLKKLGYSVELVESAKEASRKLEIHFLAIFLVDYLPDQQSERLIDLIRYDQQSINKKTPIIIISNCNKSLVNINYFFRKEITAVCVKPVVIQDFKKILRCF